MQKLVLPLLAAVLLLPARALAYGAEGHALVGAMADLRLAGTPTGARITALLDGMTLSRAATIPDEIKGWDKHGADAPGGFYLPDHPAIENQLRAFWKANLPSQTPRSDDDTDPVPSHHWFHYTDIPLLGHTRYDQGKYGRSRWDLVRMIPFCQDVLTGRIPEDNPRAITKPVALILLAHFLGDLHQPLHVGAEYFDKQGRPVDPDAIGVHEVLETQGGNSLFLILQQPPDPAAPNRRLTLHGFWDKTTVLTAISALGAQIAAENPAHPPEFTPAEIAARLAAPSGWDTAATLDPTLWAAHWATEILPLAREAHARLTYSDIQPKEDRGRILATGFVREKPTPDGKTYLQWSAEAVTREIAKGGYRLAALLEKTLP